MRTMLLSMIILSGCAGTQTLKGYNHAEPKPSESGVVEEPPPQKMVNPWIVWGVTVVSISGIAWYMFKKDSSRN